MPPKGITTDRAVAEATRAVQIVWVHRSVAVIHPLYEKDFAEYIRTGRGPQRKTIGIIQARNMADAKRLQLVFTTALALVILGHDSFNALRSQRTTRSKNVHSRVNAAIAFLTAEAARVDAAIDLRIKNTRIANWEKKIEGII